MSSVTLSAGEEKEPFFEGDNKRSKVGGRPRTSRQTIELYRPFDHSSSELSIRLAHSFSFYFFSHAPTLLPLEFYLL